jgi:Spy/CpxP family protein refolding chaperone
MKRFMQITLAAAVVVMAVSPALAQQRGRGFGGFGMNTIFLLGQKSVQEELKLNDEQIKKVKELQEKQREVFQNFRDLSPEERREKMQEMAKAVDGVLKPPQLKRVKQIALQQAGARAVNDEEVAKALNVTDEQKEKIREIQRESFEKMRELGRDEDAAKKRQELMKETNEKMMAVLTAEQKTKLKELQGEPFKGEIASPFGGRRQRQN